MRHIGAAIVVGITVSATDLRADSDNAPRADLDNLPLFSELKKFCIDTRVDPAAVKAAIEAAGGKLRASGTTEWPFPMTTTSWDHIANGHRMIVSAGTAYLPPRAVRPAMNSKACTVTSFANEDASITDILEWIGVPQCRADGEVNFCDYEEVGSERRPVGSDGGITARAEGRAWSVTIIRDPNHASVQLFNTLSLPAPGPDPGTTRGG